MYIWAPKSCHDIPTTAASKEYNFAGPLGKAFCFADSRIGGGGKGWTLGLNIHPSDGHNVCGCNCTRVLGFQSLLTRGGLLRRPSRALLFALQPRAPACTRTVPSVRMSLFRGVAHAYYLTSRAFSNECILYPRAPGCLVC